jgi:site-specific recombinase XerD
VPSYINTYAVPWSLFPETLKQEADRWRERLSGKDLLDDSDFRPLRPASLATRFRQLHELASAAVKGGIDPARLTSLADLVRPEVVRAALAFLLERHGRQPSVQTGQIANLAVIIAVHWAEASEATVTQLKKWRRKMTPPTIGLSDKNHASLRQFDDPAKLAAILLLPERLIAAAKRSKRTTRRTALLVQTAVMVELLTYSQIRIENLANLNIGEHLIRSRTRSGMMHLAVPAHEVKNRTPIEAILPKETCRLINLYIEKYRPALCNDDSSALFPGRYAGAKSKDMIREQISKTILDRTGVRMNPHLFRHFFAKHFLEDHPGAYGIVRDQLGHKSINTTTLYYCGTETAAAFRLVHEHIMNKRADKRLIVSAAKVLRHD